MTGLDYYFRSLPLSYNIIQVEFAVLCNFVVLFNFSVVDIAFLGLRNTYMP